MPRQLLVDPDLLDCLERPNPLVDLTVEVAAPEVGLTIRRASDQFFKDTGAGGPRVSEAPANSTTASAEGGMKLTPGTTALATFSGTQAYLGLNRENPARRLKAMGWVLDPAFDSALLRTFAVKVHRVISGNGLGGAFYLPTPDFQLQIYRATGTPGFIRKKNNVQVPFVNWVFTPLLGPAATVRKTAVAWDGSSNATLSFDLAPYGLVVDQASLWPASPDHAGDTPVYYFAMTAVNPPAGVNDIFQWYIDTATTRVVAGVGTFVRRWWSRNSDIEEWVEDTSFTDCPNCTLTVETFTPGGGQGQVVYVVDLSRAPTAGATGRIVFERATPKGTTATLELSTAGSGGPWTVVKHGDALAIAQQTYHLRVTLTPSASQRATPTVLALGIEFRTVSDLTAIAQADILTSSVEPPWCVSSIGQGTLRIIRDGIRDYLDDGAALAASAPTTKLEADVYLTSRHPAVTRDKWLLLERATVVNRSPTGGTEELALLSYAQKLKRKIPQRSEQAPDGAVYTVSSATDNGLQVTVTTNLVGTTMGGHEYNGKGYSLRVKSCASGNLNVGYIQIIDGSTDQTKLDFTTALPGRLANGDTIEIHSNIFQTQRVSYVDQDPADVWYDILTNLLAIPAERVGGRAGVGRANRSGLPPQLADRAPGDATTQNKLRVTMAFTQEEEADKAIDQLSFIMGGATLCVAGQIVWVPILTQRRPDGTPMLPQLPSATVFDVRDYAAIDTPTGLDRRATVLTGDYGVDRTKTTATQAKTTAYVDGDALAWLTQQDLNAFGSSKIPDDIARWCFNSTDQGLFLASMLSRSVVEVASTGLRIWTIRAIELQPNLVAGDPITIVTDQYTDYDPIQARGIAGWAAYSAVVLGVEADLKTIRALVPVTTPNAVQAIGGSAGTLDSQSVPVAIPSDFTLAQVQISTPSGGLPALRATFTTPVNPFFARMEYQVRFRKNGSSTWQASSNVQGSVAGPDLIPAAWNTEYEITPVTINTSNVRGVGSGSQIKTLAIGANPQAEFLNGSGAGLSASDFISQSDRISAPVYYDDDFTFGEIWYQRWANGSQPSNAPAQDNAVGATLLTTIRRGDNRTAVQFPLNASTDWVIVTFVPYDALNGRGVVVTVKQQGAAPAAPAAPTSVANQAHTATTVTNRVNLPGTAAAGWKIRSYRNGSTFGSDYTLVAGDITATIKDLVYTDLDPSTASNWQNTLLNLSSIESAKTPADPGLAVSTDAGTIPTPTLDTLVRTGSSIAASWTPAGGTPAGVSWHVRESTSSGGALTEVGESPTGASSLAYLTANNPTYVKVYGSKAGWTISANSNEKTA
jgi:hypothetical protein